MTLNRLCNLEDWRRPPVRRIMASLGLRADCLKRPARKHWEWAMGLWGLARAGCIHPGAVGLGIGAGHEAPLYYLARRVRLVVATDLYTGSFRGHEAHEVMWHWPGAFAPFRYPERRLLVARMDGTNLLFGNDSFDFAFSFSSVEHFGSLARIRRSLREAYRVLRPGGVYALATECEVGRPVRWPRELPGLHLFTPEEIETLIRESGFRLTEPIDYTLSARTRRHVGSLERIVRDRRTLRYPHLLVEFRGRRFTSLILFLRKPGVRSRSIRWRGGRGP